MRKIIIVAAVVVIALGAGFTYTLYKVGEGITCTAADGDSRTTEVSCNR